ncbi:hypothetical protein pb186bvf_002158 [Paramecium bursaria]
MRNRITYTHKIEELLTDDNILQKSHSIYRKQLSPLQLQQNILQSLQKKIDPDIISNKYIQRRTLEAATKLFQIRKCSQSIERKRQNLLDSTFSFYDQLQQNLIKMTESQIEKLAKKHRQRVQIESFYQSSIKKRLNEDKQEDYDQPIDMQEGLKPIEVAQKHFKNLDDRIKERTHNQGYQKYRVFWQTFSKRQSLDVSKESTKDSYIKVVDSIKKSIK